MVDASGSRGPYAPPSSGDARNSGESRYDPWYGGTVTLGPSEPEGSYWGGFVLGFFFLSLLILGLLGLLLLHLMEGSETKRGFRHGVATFVVVACLALVLLALLTA